MRTEGKCAKCGVDGFVLERPPEGTTMSPGDAVEKVVGSFARMLMGQAALLDVAGELVCSVCRRKKERLH